MLTATLAQVLTLLSRHRVNFSLTHNDAGSAQVHVDLPDPLWVEFDATNAAMVSSVRGLDADNLDISALYMAVRN